MAAAAIAKAHRDARRRAGRLMGSEYGGGTSGRKRGVGRRGEARVLSLHASVVVTHPDRASGQWAGYGSGRAGREHRLVCMGGASSAKAVDKEKAHRGASIPSRASGARAAGYLAEGPVGLSCT